LMADERERPTVRVLPAGKRGVRRIVQKKRGGRIVLRTDAFEVELDLPDLWLARLDKLFDGDPR